MQGMRIRKGDEIVVLAGKDRGKRGTVQEVRPRERLLIVAGVNLKKRHTKANPQNNVKGGIIEQPGALPIGKVMIVCPHCGQPTRVGHRIDDDEKERFCKRCDKTIAAEKE